MKAPQARYIENDTAAETAKPPTASCILEREHPDSRLAPTWCPPARQGGHQGRAGVLLGFPRSTIKVWHWGGHCRGGRLCAWQKDSNPKPSQWQASGHMTEPGLTATAQDHPKRGRMESQHEPQRMSHRPGHHKPGKWIGAQLQGGWPAACSQMLVQLHRTSARGRPGAGRPGQRRRCQPLDFCTCASLISLSLTH